MRMQSVSQFSKHYHAFTVPDSALAALAALSPAPAPASTASAAPAPSAGLLVDRSREVVEPSKRFVMADVSAAYKPKRKFKKRATANFESVVCVGLGWVVL
jgi:hypothetical protein